MNSCKLRSFAFAATTCALASSAAIAHADEAAPAVLPPVAPSSPNPPAPVAQAADEGPAAPRSPATLSVLYPLATNASQPDVTTNADLSLFYGRVGEVRGAQVGGLFSHASRGATGAQVGGLASVGGGLTGLQLSGLVNVSRERAAGAQIGGVVNVTREMAGAQVGAVNVAGSVEGLQLGVVNVGRKVRGLQLGVVNVAEDVEGGAIGLASISKDSVHPIAWTSNLALMNAGVKFTTKYLYTTVAAHYGTRESDFDAVGGSLALGAHLPLPARFDLEAQGAFMQVASWAESNAKKYETSSWVTPQLTVGYAPASRFRAFAGAGVRFPLTTKRSGNGENDVARPELLAGLQF